MGVIESLDLVLRPGLTAFTGETGAGKTMLVEAINLLVGGRADPTVVRTGAAEARVEGRFVVGDDENVVARVVPADGRSRAYVNGRLATAATLAEHGARIVDIHGQHAHQSLLSTAAQRDALDRFCGDRPRAVARRPGAADRDRRRRSPRSVATSGRGRARSTCCGSRSASSSPRRSRDADEDERLTDRGGHARRRRRASRGRAHGIGGAGRRRRVDDGGAVDRGRRRHRCGHPCARRPFTVRRVHVAAARPGRRAEPTSAATCAISPSSSTRTRSDSPRSASADNCCATCAASTATRWPT